MLPNKICDSVTCLEGLVKVRSDCADGDCADFYLEDLEGVDIKRLSEVANVGSPSGVSLGKDIISISSREMLADIEILIGNGYSLKPTFGELCSACSFIPGSYTANGRVKVLNTIGTKYSILQIHTLQILTNFTGTTVLIVADGKTQKLYSVDLVADEIANVVLEYSTLEKSATIYLQDSTIGMAKINCAVSSGCGCGGAANRAAMTTISYSGFIGLTAAPFQYGFLPCASVVCSSDLMVCDLIKQTPKLFAMTLLYKAGARYYSTAALSTRNNRTAGQEGEEKNTMLTYYAGLYKNRLMGTRTSKGLYGVISTYLQQRNDKCVVCDGSLKTAYATG